ncbi:NAD(P)-dependent oxidoreductase [Novosphingobium sp. KN65.2]|uniref:NAD(P)-dependent oxidoreductase n=1 Tax=Novosphingobium sp. KN65.2 TaxID=1478134 RepID=UPI0005E69A0C|nr:NAD(P)-binding domain-containing protein [Novosphingobium sp. KN65.2]CDO35259.1 conserved hypothetical protein [Novosphingobium sp. KN65.2]
MTIDMTGEIRSVGFVGLGDMGAKQVREIAKLPVTLTLFDMRAQAMEAFAGRATLASSLAEVGRASDLVGICVQDDEQVNACIDELLPAMKPGSVILIHATISPDTVQAIALRAEERGIEVMDAPVTRTRMTQDGPFVFCPMGGEPSVNARVQPIVDSFATHSLLAGPHGAAMALKICNNLVSWCQIIVGLESVKLAEAAGVPVKHLTDLMGTNGLLTPPMGIFAGLWTSPPQGDGWRQGLAIHAALGEKDLKLAEELASRMGSPSALATFARSIVRETVLDVGRH